MKRSGLTGLFFLSVLLLLISCEDVFRENLESKVKLATEALDTPEVSGPDSTGNSKPTWEWTVPDGTVNFRYQLDGTEGSWTETSGNQATSHTPSIELEEGEHTFYVQALGPSGKWSGSGSKTTLIDLSAPTVSAGEDIPWTNTAVTLAGTSGDTMGITSLWEVVPENPGIVFSDASSLTSTVEGPADTEGSYTLKLTCTDALGHYATDEVILNWDAKAPVPGNGGTLTFSAETIDGISLNWTAAVDLNKAAADLEYKIIRSDTDNLNTLAECQTPGEGRITVADWTAGITSVTAEGLDPAGTYYFNVLVRDPVHYESVFGMSSYIHNPPVPQIESVILQPSRDLKISWTGVTGASGYRVYRSISEDGTYTLVNGDVTGTDYTDVGLASKNTYWYKVCAYKGDVASALSTSFSGVKYDVLFDGPAGGKIIFEDLADTYPGWTYLEMAPPAYDINKQWSNGLSAAFTDAAETAIGTGASNTMKIIEVLGNGVYAAQYCHELQVGIYDDWFLPSKDELAKILETQSTVDNLSPTNYWSSSEDSISNAWMHNFGLDGDPHTNMKVDLYSVRAIRAF